MFYKTNSWEQYLENVKKAEIATRNQSYQWRVVNAETREVVSYRWNKTAAENRMKEIRTWSKDRYTVEPPIMNGHIIHGHLTVVAPL